MDLKMFQMLEFMNNRLSNIEKNINRIDEKLEFSLSLQRNHLIRVKNGEYIDDSNILMGRPYNDLSPQKAVSIYNNPDLDYIILDVSKAEYTAPLKLDGAIKIPLEELNTRYAEIQSKTTPILVFSEQGLRSIQACEILIKKGLFNLNNVSGGFRFWPKLETPGPDKRS
jgi:rhodanese-related sulfurtransferase